MDVVVGDVPALRNKKRTNSSTFLRPGIFTSPASHIRSWIHDSIFSMLELLSNPEKVMIAIGFPRRWTTTGGRRISLGAPLLPGCSFFILVGRFMRKVRRSCVEITLFEIIGDAHRAIFYIPRSAQTGFNVPLIGHPRSYPYIRTRDHQRPLFHVRLLPAMRKQDPASCASAVAWMCGVSL